MRAAELPGAAIRVVTPSLFELALLYVALGALFLRPSRRRPLLIICALLLCADAAGWYLARFHRSHLRVTFLSVGHGDCTVIEFPGSKVLVIDGGGLSATFDVGERVVAPYLWRRKIGRIDGLVLTHPDFDHYGGLGFLARQFGPEELLWNGDRGTSHSLAAFWNIVQEEKIRPVPVRRGFRRRMGGVDLLVLGPDGPSASANDNDNSLTLRLRYGATVLLLTGDIEKNGERRLVNTLAPLMRSQILKIPHHGSASSSSARMIDAVHPELAIISVGAGRRFGLPHPSVMQAYRAREIPVLRTDEGGAVILDIDLDGRRTVTRGGEG